MRLLLAGTPIGDVDDAPQGSAVTLTLKPVDTEDHLYDYSDPTKLRQLVKRYSDFIAWPIRMDVEKPAPATESDDASGDTDAQARELAAGFPGLADDEASPLDARPSSLDEPQGSSSASSRSMRASRSS